MNLQQIFEIMNLSKKRIEWAGNLNKEVGLLKTNINKEIFSWLKTIFFSLIIVAICRHFLFSPSTVYGESMAPTLKDHEKIIISKVSKLEHFDVIVFHAPDADAYYIKRIIGLPGDRIEVKDDTLYINDKPYKEPYLKPNRNHLWAGGNFTGDFTLKEITGKSKVPKGHLFVMGDNRPVSKDSRHFKFIPIKSVIGEVKFRFYPLKKIGIPE
ncbi:signal peptidase I, bacterial type [Caldibacillus debilis GB1]|uniref:Signal peptidase I n=1 Tax=Caldibacillus debilis GB1 TaxID=1339248 RepID=A0A420VFR5_9BACI|nr:signal peptidase I, bacterial type [Caldibacillus debilis GB1]